MRRLESPQRVCAASRGRSSQELDAPKLDFVFTVCDNAAKEVCPVWPGQPISAHWGIPDPPAAGGSAADVERAFRDAFLMLDRRISLFLALPLASLDNLALKKEVDKIGQIDVAKAEADR